MAIGTTYSFKDLSGAFTSPVAGSFIFSGEIGQGRVVVANTTEHGLMDTAPDGTVMQTHLPKVEMLAIGQLHLCSCVTC
jgi:hypothetical protein